KKERREEGEARRFVVSHPSRSSPSRQQVSSQSGDLIDRPPRRQEEQGEGALQLRSIHVKMLQRAASNAYSWWWASHIRTNQSKWLDANLQDMENRVKIMLKLLGQEADSFGKRAEMYYRTRPEVISHVEQLYRSYRALVERYDHI
ncbi:unnamed protein product, partial [Urochloa humidicola]